MKSIIIEAAEEFEALARQIVRLCSRHNGNDWVMSESAKADHAHLIDLAKRLRAEAEEQAWINAQSEPDEKMYEEITLAARRTFRNYKLTPHGQQVTRSDSFETHLIDAAISWERRRTEAQQLTESASLECSHCGGTGDVSGEYPGVACPDCYGTGESSQACQPSGRQRTP